MLFKGLKISFCSEGLSKREVGKTKSIQEGSGKENGEIWIMERAWEGGRKGVSEWIQNWSMHFEWRLSLAHTLPSCQFFLVASLLYIQVLSVGTSVWICGIIPKIANFKTFIRVEFKIKVNFIIFLHLVLDIN